MRLSCADVAGLWQRAIWGGRGRNCLSRSEPLPGIPVAKRNSPLCTRVPPAGERAQPCPTALERVAALGRASELRRCPGAETQRLDGDTEDLGELKPTMVTVIQQHLMGQGTYGNRTFGEPRFTDFNDPCSELAILCSCNPCKILTSLVSISYPQTAALVLVCRLRDSPAVPESRVFLFADCCPP